MKNNDLASFIDCLFLLDESGVDFTAEDFRLNPEVPLNPDSEGYAIALQKAVALCQANGLSA